MNALTSDGVGRAPARKTRSPPSESRWHAADPVPPAAMQPVPLSLRSPAGLSGCWHRPLHPAASKPVVSWDAFQDREQLLKPDDLLPVPIAPPAHETLVDTSIPSPSVLPPLQVVIFLDMKPPSNPGCSRFEHRASEPCSSSLCAAVRLLTLHSDPATVKWGTRAQLREWAFRIRKNAHSRTQTSEKGACCPGEASQEKKPCGKCF